MRQIDDIIEKKRFLLPILEEIQLKFRHLPKDKLIYVSKKLGIPLSKIYGVASFYLLFSMERLGRNVIKVCNGPSCHLNGSRDLLEYIKNKIKTEVGKTRNDNKYTLGLVSCLGCCDKAPAIYVNGKVYGKMTKGKFDELIKKLK